MTTPEEHQRDISTHLSSAYTSLAEGDMKAFVAEVVAVLNYCRWHGIDPERAFDAWERSLSPEDNDRYSKARLVLLP